jgi:hypothetical protein
LAPCHCLPEGVCIGDCRHGRKQLPVVSPPTSQCELESAKRVLIRRLSWPLVAPGVVSSGMVAAAGKALLPCRPPAHASAADTSQVGGVWYQHAPVLTTGTTFCWLESAKQKTGNNMAVRTWA